MFWEIFFAVFTSIWLLGGIAAAGILAGDQSTKAEPVSAPVIAFMMLFWTISGVFGLGYAFSALGRKSVPK